MHSQHSCLYIIYILTKSEFLSSCSRPAVGLNIVQITCATFFVNVFFYMAAGSHFGCPKITMYLISYHFRSIPQFLFLLNFGCPKITFDRISGHFISIPNFFSNFCFTKMAVCAQFRCLKITLDRISGHFRSIRNFFLKKLQNDRRRPFWMSEIHFRSYFWPFQIDTQL